MISPADDGLKLDGHRLEDLTNWKVNREINWSENSQSPNKDYVHVHSSIPFNSSKERQDTIDFLFTGDFLNGRGSVVYITVENVSN